MRTGVEQRLVAIEQDLERTRFNLVKEIEELEQLIENLHEQKVITDREFHELRQLLDNLSWIKRRVIN